MNPFLSRELFFQCRQSFRRVPGLLLLSKTDKIFLETPVTAGLRFHALKLGKAGFYGRYEFVHVFSNEDFQHEISAPL